MATGYLVRIAVDGTVTRIRIARKTGPTVEQIQTSIDGKHFARLGVVYEGQRRTAYVDEDAKMMKTPPPVNSEATRMLQEFYAGQAKTVDILGTISVWVPDTPVPESVTDG